MPTHTTTNDKYPKIPLTTKFTRFFSSSIFTVIKPKILSWLLIYKLKNSDPDGAKKLYQSISDETSLAYR